ncbi:MAG TPA: energy-coupling factor transporter transmembrane component T [Candidatus Dormibacteraeota bacterium]|nr:energy-coupling factor transporter transmembrane component T [Candidatus Dormibacteraeota bacterium]
MEATAAPRSSVPEYVGRRATGPYRGLTPATKLTIAVCEALVAFVVRGWTGPLVVLALVVVTARVAGVSRRMVPFVLATLPLIVSILLVNTFLLPGATDVIVRLGPFAATGRGLEAALQAALRVVAFALSVAVFSLTTSTDELLADLEARGLGRRGTFVIGSAIGTIPRMAARAGEIVESQRARGLDTEGSFRRRAQGLLPLAGPMILGALSEVEERTLSLEARAFSARVRRTALRAFVEAPVERAARWVVAVGTVALLVATVSGAVRLA